MEPGLKLASIRTLGPVLGSVRKLHNVFTILNTSHFENASQINDFGAINTGKPRYLLTLACGFPNRSIGSPNNMYVRRVSESVILALALLIASPRVNEGSVKRSLTRF